MCGIQGFDKNEISMCLQKSKENILYSYICFLKNKVELSTCDLCSSFIVTFSKIH